MITILNEKVYFCDSLFDFIMLDNSLKSILFKTIQNDFPFELLKAESICFYNLIEGHKPFTVYKFVIEKYNPEKKMYFLFKNIEKRYSDFRKLHESLEIYYKNLHTQGLLSEKFQIPELPPRVSLYGQKTSANQRVKDLEVYLN